jgi:hypothetical protein
MNTAYQDLPQDHRQRLVLDTFQNTINHAYLQRHLLAINPRTLKDAVRAGNEFLQIKTTNFPGSQVRSIDEMEYKPIPDVQAVQTNPLDSLVKMIQQLTSEVSSIKESQKNFQAREIKKVENNKYRNPEQLNNRTNVCWGCNQPGHTKRECKVNPWNNPRSMSGNGSGPPQW